MNKKKYISLANKAANIQITELKKIKKVFNNSFIKAVDLILNCKGKVIFAGIGKSGLIARKISATFSSVGISSFFCHPSEALHGDMGQIEKKDVLIIFSYLIYRQDKASPFYIAPRVGRNNIIFKMIKFFFN